jgi:hypothetical protein
MEGDSTARLMDIARSEGCRICTLITHSLAAFTGALDRSQAEKFKALDHIKYCEPCSNGGKLELRSKQDDRRLHLVLQETRYVPVAYPDIDDSQTVLVETPQSPISAASKLDSFRAAALISLWRRDCEGTHEHCVPPIMKAKLPTRVIEVSTSVTNAIRLRQNLGLEASYSEVVLQGNPTV